MSSLCSDGETLEGLQAHMEAVLTQSLEGDQYILYFSDAFYIFLCYPKFANAANKLGKN